MRTVLSIMLSISAFMTWAQPGKVLEEIVAVIGEHVILKTDLETEYAQALQETDFFDGDLKCEVLNQLIIQKLYLHKGELDSVTVIDERVNAEVDRRVQYFAAQIGGEAQLERYLGKPIDQYREQMAVRVREQMIIQEVQRGLISNVKVSPTQVQQYFNAIPKDSLPVFSKEVEVAQIVMSPEASAIAKQIALDEINKVRQDLLAGKYSFEFLARTKSDDKGTAVNGGELGYFGRGKMVPEFERTAFSLKKDSISEVVETKFGYHIIQMIDRKGEQINARHILIRPLIVQSDLDALRKEMQQLIDRLKEGKTSLCESASMYSTDPMTKDNCGFFVDPSTGAQQVEVSRLEPSVATAVSKMTEGEYTAPTAFTNYDGNTAYKFIYLKSVRPEHTANLDDDYQKLQLLAQEEEQGKAIERWVNSFKKGVFIHIDEKYANCKELEAWKGLN